MVEFTSISVQVPWQQHLFSSYSSKALRIATIQSRYSGNTYWTNFGIPGMNFSFNSCFIVSHQKLRWLVRVIDWTLKKQIAVGVRAVHRIKHKTGSRTQLPLLRACGKMMVKSLNLSNTSIWLTSFLVLELDESILSPTHNS